MALFPPKRSFSMTQATESKTIFVIGGPAGSGKTTVATYISQLLQIHYLEGDKYHNAENKAKMSSGLALTDADRWDWLISIREAATKKLESCNAVIVTCSILRRKYRDVIRTASCNRPHVKVCFIYLKVNEMDLRARVTRRVGHYMKESMVQSQLDVLEEPEQDEIDVFEIDAGYESVEVGKEALARVCLELNVRLFNESEWVGY